MNLPPVLMLFLGYATLFLIGIGPSVWLIPNRNPRRIALALCIAPVVGLAESGLILYPLTLYDMLIVDTAYPLAIATIAVSIGLLILNIRRAPLAYRQITTRRKGVFVATSFAITTVLLLLSFIVGGQHTQLWPGNPWDAFDYITVAQYTKILPVSYLQSTSHIQDILQTNPAFSQLVGTGIVLSRPVASNTLAWLSVLFHIPTFSGYYFLKMLFVLLIFGSTLAVCIQARMSLRWTIACAVVLTIGFWSFLVIEIDALSELAGLSLCFLTLFTWLCLEQEAPQKLASRQRLFLSFALAAVMIFYAEIFVELVASIGFYYLIRFVHKPLPLSHHLRVFAGLVATGIFTLLLQLPDLQTTLNFMFQQTNAAMSWGYDWDKVHHYVFSWLFDSRMPFRDVWGLHLFQLPEPLTGINGYGFLWLIPFVFGIVLTYLFTRGILQSLLRATRSLEYKMLAALVATFGGTAAFFLFSHNQTWITGKALSMGLPFVTVAMFFYVDRRLWPPQFFRNVIIIWLITQTINPVLHAIISVDARNYPAYAQLMDHPTWSEIEPVLDSLTTRPPQMLGVNFSQPESWLPIFWTLNLAEKTKVSRLPTGGTYLQEPSDLFQNSDVVPDELLLSPDRDFLSPLHLGRTLANNPDFVLSAVTPDELDQAVMSSALLDSAAPSAVGLFDADQTNGQGQPARWTLQRNFPSIQNPEQTVFRFWASGKTVFATYLQYTSNFKGNVAISVNGVPTSQQSLNSTDSQQVVFCVGKPGINTITLDYTVKELLGIGQDNQRLLLQSALFAPNGKLDVGSQAEQSLIGDGWYGPDQVDNVKVRWSEQDSRLLMLTCKPPSILRFRAFVPQVETRTVNVTLNGKLLGPVRLEGGWHEYSLPIPPDTYRDNGKQIIDLSHDKADSLPNDTRAISAAYDWFVLE